MYGMVEGVRGKQRDEELWVLGLVDLGFESLDIVEERLGFGSLGKRNDVGGVLVFWVVW